MIITVTGSTGTIGHELLDLLSKEGAPVRAVLRNFTRARTLPRVAWVRADLQDAGVLEPVLAGTERLFVLSGNKPGFGEMQSTLIETAANLGVKYIVKLSALGATPRSKSPLALEHWQAEETLRNVGVDWTILRPHAFMQNWLSDHGRTVREEGRIYAAIGEGRVPFIDARDIAAVAAEVLLRPERHAGRTYVLTGKEAVGYADVAAAITKATDKRVTYQPLTADEMRARLEEQGLGPELIKGYLALASYQAAGGPTEKVHDGVNEVTGRPPRSVQEFIDDHREQFQPVSSTT